MKLVRPQFLVLTDIRHISKYRSNTRFINWKIYPDDETLKVGPNIFAELDLPNGERDFGVTFTPPAVAKQYTLTASVTYGVINQAGAEEIKEAPCIGSAKVIMP